MRIERAQKPASTPIQSAIFVTLVSGLPAAGAMTVFCLFQPEGVALTVPAPLSPEQSGHTPFQKYAFSCILHKAHDLSTWLDAPASCGGSGATERILRPSDNL
jgi:hypothetical protein